MFPGRAQIIRADGRAVDRCTGHPVDTRRFGSPIDGRRAQRGAPAPPDGAGYEHQRPWTLAGGSSTAAAFTGAAAGAGWVRRRQGGDVIIGELFI